MNDLLFKKKRKRREGGEEKKERNMGCYPGSLPGEGNLAVKQSKADLWFHWGFISNSPQKYV